MSISESNFMEKQKRGKAKKSEFRGHIESPQPATDFHNDSEVVLGHCSMRRNNYSIVISQCNFTIWYFIEINVLFF